MKHKSRNKMSRETSRQHSFKTNWSVNDKKKQYDALEDKHASYYFVGKSVKRHMKTFKKVNPSDRTRQLQKRKEMMDKNKIKFKFPEIQNNSKVNIYSNEFEQLQWHTRKSMSRNKSTSRRNSNLSIHVGSRPKRSINFPDLTSVNDSKQLESIRQIYQNDKSLNNNPQQEQLESELLHKKQHNKFVRFLQKKRDTVKQKMTTSKSQLSLSQKSETNSKDKLK